MRIINSEKNVGFLENGIIYNEPEDEILVGEGSEFEEMREFYRENIVDSLLENKMLANFFREYSLDMGFLEKEDYLAGYSYIPFDLIKKNDRSVISVGLLHKSEDRKVIDLSFGECRDEEKVINRFDLGNFNRSLAYKSPMIDFDNGEQLSVPVVTKGQIVYVDENEGVFFEDYKPKIMDLGFMYPNVFESVIMVTGRKFRWLSTFIDDDSVDRLENRLKKL